MDYDFIKIFCDLPVKAVEYFKYPFMVERYTIVDMIDFEVK